ncbi:MAG: DUF4136 domain-containing protein [Pseudomonadota bacterium]
MIRKTVLALAAALSLGACSTTGSFTSDFDDQQDFTSYKTFAWADESPMSVYGEARIPPTAEPKISRVLKAELESKGFTYVANKENADFAVSFSIGTRSEEKVTQTPTYFYGNRTNWRWGRGYHPGAYPLNYSGAYAGTQTTVSSYTEGALAVDIFDVKRKSPVWHGAGVKTLSKAEQRGDNALTDPVKLREGIAKILTDFPPQ